MSGREAVLGKVRRAVAARGGEATRRQEVADRMAATRPNLIPGRGQLDLAGRTALFCAMAEHVHATVARLPSAEAVPEGVADYLRLHNLPAEIRIGADPRLAALRWDSVPQLEIRHGASDGRDMAAVSHAFGGVAESGTLVLVSGEDNPTTLNFLPDTHIVVIDAADIAGDYEAVLARIRARYGAGEMPRTVNMVTGPSRSADIEQTLILGAHGPRALHILVVG